LAGLGAIGSAFAFESFILCASGPLRFCVEFSFDHKAENRKAAKPQKDFWFD
jgi:hypothetical protein